MARSFEQQLPEQVPAPPSFVADGSWGARTISTNMLEECAGQPTLTTGQLSKNVVLSIIGTALLGIGAQMKRGGAYVTPFIICFACIVLCEMTRIVARTIDILESKGMVVKSYTDFAEGSFGRVGKSMASVALNISLIGCLCTGGVMEAKIMPYAIGSIPYVPWPHVMVSPETGRKFWAVMLAPVFVFYAVAQPTKLLQKTAFLAPYVCALCALMALIAAVSGVRELEEFPAECRERAAGAGAAAAMPYWSFWPWDAVVGAGVQQMLLNLFGIFSYGFYCFAVVITMPTLRSQMSEPRKVAAAASLSYVLCTLLFLVIMVLSYWGFGNLMPESLMDSMRCDRPDGWWATARPWETGRGTVSGQIFAWLMFFNLMVTDGIYVPASVIELEKTAPRLFTNRVNKIALRLALVLFKTLVAAWVDSFIDLTNLTSALFCVLVNLLMPIVAFHRHCSTEAGTFLKLGHGFIFVLGCGVVVLGTASAVQGILHSSTAEPIIPGTFPGSGISEECVQLYRAANVTFAA